MDTRGYVTDIDIEDPPGDLTTEAAQQFVAHPDRRVLLQILRSLETRERLSSLTRNLAQFTDRTGEDQMRGIYVRLYHVHVPKLESAGLVETDDLREMVQITEAGEKLAEQLPSEL